MRPRRSIELLTLLALLSPLKSPAQSGMSQSGSSVPARGPDWVGSYSSGLVRGSYSVVTARSDRDGNLYVAGSGGTLPTGTDYVLCKYSLTGELLWSARYNGPGNPDEQLVDLAVGDSGQACLTGYVKNAAGLRECLTVKYDSQGHLQWADRFKIQDSTSRDDFARSVAVGPGGSIYMLEASQNSEYFPQTVTNLVRYAPDGRVNWVAAYSFPLFSPDSLPIDSPYQMLIDQASNAYVLISSTISTHTDAKTFITLVKFDPAGRQRWAVRYRNPERDFTFPVGMGFDPSGSITICGSSSMNGGGASEGLFLRCDTTGQLLGVALFPGGNQGNPGIAAFALDSRGNPITVVYDSLYPQVEMRIRKSHPDGSLIWSSIFGFPNSATFVAAAAADPLDRVAVTGYTGKHPYQDFFLALFDLQGRLLWSRTYSADSLSQDEPQALVITPSSRLLVAGTSFYPEPYRQPWRDFTAVQYGPTGTLEWARSYNGCGYSLDQAVDVTFDDADRAIVLGSSQGSGQDRDFLVAVFDKDGTFLWAQRLDGGLQLDDLPARVQCDRSNNIIVTGTSVTSPTTSDVLTAKYSPSGELLWQARIPHAGAFYTPAGALAVDSAGGVFVGVPFIAEGGSSSWKVVKYGPAGAELWSAQETISASRTLRSIALAVDPQGYLYAGGGIGDSTFVARFTGDGQLEWEGYYALSGVRCAILTLAVDREGNVLAAGSTSGPFGGPDGYLTLMYSSAGVRQWTADERSLTQGYALSIFPGTDGAIYVGGTPLLIKYSADGNRLWFAGDVANYAVASRPRPGIDAENTMYNVEGTGSAYQHHDVITNGINSAGILFWSDRYSEGPSLVPAALAVHPSGRLWVAATASYSAGVYSTALRVIAYSKATTAVPLRAALPERFMLGQNFPNPFNPTTVIPFALPHRSHVRLTVFNMLGQRVAELVDGNCEAGYHEVHFDASSLATGMYLYRLQAGSLIGVKKFCVLR